MFPPVGSRYARFLDDPIVTKPDNNILIDNLAKYVLKGVGGPRVSEANGSTLCIEVVGKGRVHVPSNVKVTLGNESVATEGEGEFVSFEIPEHRGYVRILASK